MNTVDSPTLRSGNSLETTYRSGDWVEIRSKEEILRTLDKKGQLHGLPFMPQMFQYCGRTFRVYKRAHKTCDTINPIRGLRVSSSVVHLDLRCDGVAYGGCQAACLLYWNEAWLRPISETGITTELSSSDGYFPIPLSADTTSCTEADVWEGIRIDDWKAPGEPRYACQATQLHQFTTFLPWWDVRQYLEDYTAGNATLRQLLKGFVYAGYTSIAQAGIGLGPSLRWLYDRVQCLWGGMPYPRTRGAIPTGTSTPTCSLNLQPGELVRVKSHEEILSTLDTIGNNKGLSFDREMVPYCGGIYRVRTRLNKFIDEKTGYSSTTKNVAIILEGVWCRAQYSNCRMFCPRSIYPWWREIWLERVAENGTYRLQGDSNS